MCVSEDWVEAAGGEGGTVKKKVCLSPSLQPTGMTLNQWSPTLRPSNTRGLLPVCVCARIFHIKH